MQFATERRDGREASSRKPVEAPPGLEKKGGAYLSSMGQKVMSTMSESSCTASLLLATALRSL